MNPRQQDGVGLGFRVQGPGFRGPSTQLTLGIHVHKYYLHWAIWICRVMGS